MCKCDSCKHGSKRATEYPCYVCLGSTKYEPITNADRIRNMTDEELADFLGGNCNERMPDRFCAYPVDHEMCRECYFEWLQAEVKEGVADAETV